MGKRNELLICGYFRQLSNGNESPPGLISHICAAYYLISDEWDLKRKHDPIILSDDNSVIHHDANSWNTIVGTNICKIGQRYQWTLKIVDVMSDTGNTWKILVGIMDEIQCDILFESDTVPFNRYFTRMPNSFGFIGSPSGITINGSFNKKYGKPFDKKGDCIVVDLDMHKDKHSLSFVINGTEYGKAFDVDINTRYRLAVSICGGRKVKLCDVEHT